MGMAVPKKKEDPRAGRMPALQGRGKIKCQRTASEGGPYTGRKLKMAGYSAAAGA